MISWLTRRGGRLDDTDIFRQEHPKFDRGVSELTRLRHSTTGITAPALAQRIVNVDRPNRSELFLCLASTCLTLTGQSDNALKCQFPVFLFSGGFHSAIALLRLPRPTITQPALRPVQLERVAKKISDPRALPVQVEELVTAYFSCVLENSDVDRLTGALEAISAAPVQQRFRLTEMITVSTIRGSATASAGHHPEEQLRLQMEEWGLIRGEDFNSHDVPALELSTLVNRHFSSDGETRAQKSRAFDFVLPYRVSGWQPRLLVQGQFYAGDSGSVSHKNVDQTTTGRSAAREVVAEPIFGEFLDGAGYVTALSGDAQRLLTMADTGVIIQLRTACIRLREALQRIRFVTPLEVVHELWRSNVRGVRDLEIALEHTCSAAEAQRAVNRALELGWLEEERGTATVAPAKVAQCFKYAVLDSIAFALSGRGRGGSSTRVTAPGYGCHDTGVDIASVVQALRGKLPELPEGIDDSGVERVVRDLVDIGWVLEV